MISLVNKLQDLLDSSRHLDFLAPLLLRAYLAPVFYMAGSQKLNSFNNGIEFAATYFVMLLALLYLGGGHFISVDYWIARKFRT